MSAKVGYANGIKELEAHAAGMVDNLSQREDNNDLIELLARVHARMLLNISELRTYATQADLEATLAFSLGIKKAEARKVLEFTHNNAG